MVISLKNAAIEEVKLYIQKKSNTIRTLFSTIKLVTDSYQKNIIDPLYKRKNNLDIINYGTIGYTDSYQKI